MKSNTKNRFVFMGNVAVISSVTLFSALLAHARTPLTPEEIATQNKEHMAVVKQGDDLWHDSSLGTNGLACATCHPDGAAVGPQTFPKYQLDMGQVVTLRDIINWCILIPMQGPPLDVNGPQMKAMEAYAYYMSRGMKLTPGDNSKQYSPVKVNSGLGYPTLDNDGWKGDGFKKNNPKYDPPVK